MMKLNWHFKLALIDLDGTLYRGHQVIPGAAEFVERVRGAGTQPVFFTNNATRTPQEVSELLNRLGIVTAASEVCTAAQASAAYLARQLKPQSFVACVGGKGLLEELRTVHLRPLSVHEEADVARFAEATGAVVGLDVEVTYHKLATLCQVVSRVGGFVLTNPDVQLPAEGIFLPGNGAIGSFVSTACGVKPVVIGKPSSEFVQYALQRFHARCEETVIVGDNWDTDIAAGLSSGLHGMWVKSGVRYKNLDEIEGLGRDDSQFVETYDSVADILL